MLYYIIGPNFVTLSFVKYDIKNQCIFYLFINQILNVSFKWSYVNLNGMCTSLCSVLLFIYLSVLESVT